MQPGPYKRCRTCGESKPLEDFYEQRQMRDGRLNICKLCHNAQSRARSRARRTPLPTAEWSDPGPDFGHWLAGFIDGEGSFSIRRVRGRQYPCSFQLGLHIRDEAVLHEIVERTGLGYVTCGEKIRGWHVTSKAHCLGLVELLDQYPMRAVKGRDFDVWREAVHLWAAMRIEAAGFGNGHLPGDWSAIAPLRDQLQAGRS